MSKMLLHHPVRVETTFGSLLRELQLIWDEVGETEAEMDKMLLELEQECLAVYRRKVEQASQARARLHQSLAEKEGELANLFAVLGERPLLPKTERKTSTLKEQLAIISPQLEDLRIKKEQRVEQFVEVKSQIQKICGEISGSSPYSESELFSGDGEDLSLRRLDEHHAQLQTLQKEKSDRLHKVLECVNALHDLCAVLGMDFVKTINDIHPSLSDSGTCQQPKSISNDTLDRLSTTIQSLLLEKKQRTQTLQGLASSLSELWKLMDTPRHEQKVFCHVNGLNGLSSEVSTSGGLSLEVIDKVTKEVQRLELLKASKMKELVVKKRMELEDICRVAHMEPDASTAPDKTNAMIDSGMVDASELLTNLEEQIVLAKEEAYSRKEILDKVEKWFTACQEESWLEDYSMDHNRYNAGRGVHLNLKRAERARITVTKLPALVNALTAKTRAWEEDKGSYFLFDGVRLLSMLDDYTFSRHEREEAKKRMRDQKRLQEQLMTEQEALYGSKPSPTKLAASQSFRRLGNGGGPPSTPSTPRRSSTRPSTPDSTPRSNGHRPNSFHNRRGSAGSTRPSAPLNFVAMQHQQHQNKDDTASLFSAGASSESASPIGTATYA